MTSERPFDSFIPPKNFYTPPQKKTNFWLRPCRSSPDFDTCSMVTRIYKIGSQFFLGGGAPRQNLASQKHQNLVQISDNFAPGSQMSPERTKISSLQSAISGCARARNLVNFSQQTVKYRTGVSTEPTRSRYVGHVS